VTSIELEVVSVSHKLAESIKDHAIRENEKGGYEAVGFLCASEDSDILAVRVPLHNHADNPSKSFFVEPWEQFRAETKITNSGYHIVGVYHSHPTSEAIPSGMDTKMARPGEIMAIYSVAFDDLRLWREHEGHLVGVGVSYA
jgi:proteasome lid subunit RPN8/RPN11